jgi:ferredoxin
MNNPAHEITIKDKTFQCREDTSLLIAMGLAGEKEISVGCRAGGCGVCKVRVISGEYETKAMSQAQVSEQEQADKLVLACRVFPRSDMTIVTIE